MSILRYIPERIKQPIRNILGLPHPYGLPLSERRRLKDLPRYKDTSVRFFGKNLEICDSASFLSSHEDIYIQKIYHFVSDCEQPTIIDAGANIGLATLYFAQSFPGAQIISIEPDSHIIDLLRNNVNTYQLDNVDIRYGAAWTNSEDLFFSADHADAGRLSVDGSEVVPGIRLRDLLEKQEVDFLKIDIEGAETAVLEDCGELLRRAKRIFVEFHSRPDEPQTLSLILKLLESNGFRYYIDRTGVHSSHPLAERQTESGFDLQLNVFATQIDEG